MKQVHIIDYGIGNIYNVARAFKYVGAEVVICPTPELLKKANCIVLAGVGAFGDCIQALHEKGFMQFLLDYAHAGGLLLGICIGMHLFANYSEEFGLHKGLGIIPGVVNRISSHGDENIKIPHIAWQKLEFNHNHKSLLSSVEFDYQPWVYYLHSYVFNCKNQENLIAYSMYQNKLIPAIININNVYGFQFHPEKSGTVGLRFLKNLIYR